MKLIEKDAVRVAKKEAESLRRKLLALDLLDEDFKPAHKGKWVFFPLKKLDEGLKELLKGFNAEIDKFAFEPRPRRPKSLKEMLRGKIPKELLKLIPSSYDVIGNVILIEIPNELSSYAKIIGEELLKTYPRIKSILAKHKTRGIYRIREIQVVAGSHETETVHREHGCLYKLDLSKVFFNPRFSGERLRVAKSVEPGEEVLDMFAGVGAFTVLIAKTQPTSKITAIEINPYAYRYLVENLKLNKVEGRVIAIKGDARRILESKNWRFDRVIMDLPHDSIKFLDVGIRACKIGGVVNFYIASSSIEEAVRSVFEKASVSGYLIEVEFTREVMEIAPRKYTIALDLRRLR